MAVVPIKIEMPGQSGKGKIPPKGDKSIGQRCPKCYGVHPKGKCPKNKPPMMV